MELQQYEMIIMDYSDNSKYYIPDISDLFVGYECEFLEDPSIEKWIPWRFKNIFEGASLISIRTPYLTYEQIEKEGWTTTEEDGDSYTRKGLYEVSTITLDQDGKITIFLVMVRDGKSVYTGQCPSVNEFRKICKLLGI